MPSSKHRPGNERLKEAIMLILSNSESIKSIGMKKLAKLLYFADFNHYEETRESITSETYIRADHGPLPSSLYDAVEQLDSEGKISASKDAIPEGVEKWNFELEEDLEPKYLEPEHQERILEVLNKLEGLSANQMEELSHRDTPWQVTEDRDEIKYKLVFYRDDEIEEFFEY